MESNRKDKVSILIKRFKQRHKDVLVRLVLVEMAHGLILDSVIVLSLVVCIVH